jgi:hypothetical protein
LRNGGFDVPILDDEDEDDDDDDDLDEAVPEAVLEVEATALRDEDEDEDEDDAVFETVLEVEATALLDEDEADKADAAVVVDLGFFFAFSLFSPFSSTKPPIFNFSSDQFIRSTHLTRSIIFCIFATVLWS